MKIIFNFVFLMILGTVQTSEAVKTTSKENQHVVTFPEIISWANLPAIEFEQEKKAPLKKDHPLKNAFFVKTGALDEVSIRFSGGETLQVFPGAKVSVPQISPDTGEISEITLIEGRIRLKSGRQSKNIRLKSAFFDLKFPTGLDAFITIDMQQPSARFDVIQGELLAVFFDYEKQQQISGGESVTFKGQREGESIKYDYLLDSRKAPHGVLQPVEKFEAKIYSEQENLQKKKKQQEIEKQNKVHVENRRKQQAYENLFLCKKPFGQKDQCYWQMKNSLCYRYRCNVGGQWGDETERPEIAACSSGKVMACDY